MKCMYALPLNRQIAGNEEIDQATKIHFHPFPPNEQMYHLKFPNLICGLSFGINMRC